MNYCSQYITFINFKLIILTPHPFYQEYQTILASTLYVVMIQTS